jgi:hypothetical protein
VLAEILAAECEKLSYKVKIAEDTISRDVFKNI